MPGPSDDSVRDDSVWDDSPQDDSPRETDISGDRIRTAVDAALARFVTERRARLAGLGPDADPLLDLARDFVAGGKRLRARFCHAGWRIAGGGDEPGIVEAAAAWEWLQASALVHDDLIDDSDTRRGRPSLHRAVEQQHRDSGGCGDSAAHGRAVAVLVGDLMLSWAGDQLRDCGLPTTPRGLDVFDRTVDEVIGGQYLDTVAQSRRTVDEDEVMRVVRYKAAAYTIERPLHLGAVLAGGDDELQAALTEIALPLGSAFQLRDDVLGVFGDPEVTGKPAGDDLREGKRTLLVARTIALGTVDDAAAVADGLGTAEAVGDLRDRMIRTGALASVEADISRLAKQADRAIDALPPVARDILTPLATRSIRRSA